MGGERPRDAFKKGSFPESIIPPSMVKTLTFAIDMPPNTPRLREFRLSDGMLILKTPGYMAPPLEFCDHLLAINDVEIKTHADLQDVICSINKNDSPYLLTIKIRRVMGVEPIVKESDLPSNASIRKKKNFDPRCKPTDGYEYFKVTAVYFPKSKLGLNVKSYEDVVYVETTDNTWGSTMKRSLYVGDAILKIDDTEIRDVQTTQQVLSASLKNKGVVTMIIERAVSLAAANYVRCVLMFSKANDPQLASDVIQICKKQYDIYFTKGFGPEPVPIYKERQSSDKSKIRPPRVTFRKTFQEYTIGNDQYNPATMQKVPNLMISSNVEKAMAKH